VPVDVVAESGQLGVFEMKHVDVMPSQQALEPLGAVHWFAQSASMLQGFMQVAEPPPVPAVPVLATPPVPPLVLVVVDVVVSPPVPSPPAPLLPVPVPVVLCAPVPVVASAVSVSAPPAQATASEPLRKVSATQVTAECFTAPDTT
jgi:hypothetical protein